MLVGVLLAFCASAGTAQVTDVVPRAPADKQRVLERYRGTWDVTTRIRQPKAATVTSVETWDWVLDNRFMRGETRMSSDGTQALVMAGYDPTTGGFPFVIYVSTGNVYVLSAGLWTEATQTLEWKNAPAENITYSNRCVFAQPNLRRCTVLAKDWKGKVLLDQESSAVRR